MPRTHESPRELTRWSEAERKQAPQSEAKFLSTQINAGLKRCRLRWLYALFYKGLNITSAWIIFPLANVYHKALGRRSIIKTYSVRLHVDDSFRNLMLLLWQLLIELLGLFFEPTQLLDDVLGETVFRANFHTHHHSHKVKPVFSGTHINNYHFYCLKPLLNGQTNYVTSFNMPGTKFWLCFRTGQCISVVFLQAFIQKLGYQYRFMTYR